VYTTPGGDDEDNKRKAPRIRIKLSMGTNEKSEDPGKKSKKPSKLKDEEVESTQPEETTQLDSVSIPRKRSLRSAEPTLRRKRARKTREGDADIDNEDADEGPDQPEERDMNTTSSKKARGEKRKNEREESNIAEKYLDVQYWKKFREGLDRTFAAARNNLMKHGPWLLPKCIPDDRFADVAKATLAKMDR
jgi:hypothetical protein